MPADSLVPIQIGDTFLFGAGSHLWMVISDPAKNSGTFVMMNLTTDMWRAGNECELNKGDHPWIKEKCYVSFGDAREVSPKQAKAILDFIVGGQVQKHFPLAKPILQKIVTAAKSSDALSPLLKKFIS